MFSYKLDSREIDNELLAQIINLDQTEIGYPWTKKQWKDAFKNKNYRLIYLDNKKQVLGFLLGILSEEERLFHLLKIIVHPKERKNGHGQSLMDQLFNYLKTQKIRKIFLEVEELNFDAIRLYEKNGINKICLQKRFYSDGKNAWKMLKP